MSDSTFNPEQFLGTQTDTAGETKFFPVPVGEWTGQCTKCDARQFTSEKNGNTYTVLEYTWEVTDQAVKDETRLERPTVRQSVFVDLTPAGGLDFGRNKNIQLGRLRAAVGQNKDGRAWAPTHIVGQMAKLKVSHRPDNNGDPQAQVDTVSAL